MHRKKGIAQTQIAEDIEIMKSYVNRVIKKPDGVANNTYAKMMRALGYDISPPDRMGADSEVDTNRGFAVNTNGYA